MASKDLSFLTNSTSSRLEATALEKAKRAAELEEMRRLRAQSSTATPDWDNGSAPITDIEEWRNSQKNKAEEERRKKMEAAEGLHGYRGKEVPGVGKKRDVDSKVFKQWEGKGQDGEFHEQEEEERAECSQEEEEGNGANNVNEESCVDVKGAVGKFESGGEVVVTEDKRDDDGNKVTEEPKEPEPVVEEEEPQVETKDVEMVEETEPKVQETAPAEKDDAAVPGVEVNCAEEEAVETLIDMLKTAETADGSAKKEEETAPPQPEEPEPEPSPEPEPVVEEPTIEEPVPPEPSVEEPVVEEPTVEEPIPTPPPTYTRTDVKFSFGLIVRSNHPTGNFDENLRDQRDAIPAASD
jgi:hypothetical protein